MKKLLRNKKKKNERLLECLARLAKYRGAWYYVTATETVYYGAYVKARSLGKAWDKARDPGIDWGEPTEGDHFEVLDVYPNWGKP